MAIAAYRIIRSPAWKALPLDFAQNIESIDQTASAQIAPSVTYTGLERNAIPPRASSAPISAASANNASGAQRLIANAPCEVVASTSSRTAKATAIVA